MGSSTYLGGSHLRFIKNPLKKGHKLHTYDMFNNKLHDYIGIIHWRGGWRQYVSQTSNNVDVSRSCHKEIIKFIDKLMKEWRSARIKSIRSSEKK